MDKPSLAFAFVLMSAICLCPIMADGSSNKTISGNSTKTRHISINDNDSNITIAIKDAVEEIAKTCDQCSYDSFNSGGNDTIICGFGKEFLKCLEEKCKKANMAKLKVALGNCPEVKEEEKDDSHGNKLLAPFAIMSYGMLTAMVFTNF